MTRSSLGLGGLVAVGIFACAAPPRARPPLKEESFVLSDDTPDGGDSSPNRVVLLEPDSGNAFDGYWRVSDDDAEHADEGVEAYLRSERPDLANKLGDYYGQIFGILDASGRKLIHFNFVCKAGLMLMKPTADKNSAEAAMSDWQHHVLIAFDGGDCYFQLDFDPKTGDYESLTINGRT